MQYWFLNHKVKVKLLSHVQLFATPWTIAHQAPPSMKFSRQEYWSALPFPSPGDLPDPGIKPRSSALWADAFTICITREAVSMISTIKRNNYFTESLRL